MQTHKNIYIQIDRRKFSFILHRCAHPTTYTFIIIIIMNERTYANKMFWSQVDQTGTYGPNRNSNIYVYHICHFCNSE